MSGLQRIRRIQPDQLAKPAADTVALDGVADFAGHRETDPYRAFVASVAGLQHKAGGWHFDPAGCGHEIRSLFQALHRAGLRGRP
jgi:hypothetical protein